MTIKNKKYFFRGILFILLGLVIALVRFLIFSQNVHGLPLRPILGIGACLFIGIVHMVLAFHNDSEDNETEGKK